MIRSLDSFTTEEAATLGREAAEQHLGLRAANFFVPETDNWLAFNAAHRAQESASHELRRVVDARRRQSTEAATA